MIVNDNPNKQAELDEIDSRIKEFKDISYISGYAFESMKSFVSTDIIQGNNGYLKPRDNTTRAEATQIIYKVISLWE